MGLVRCPRCCWLSRTLHPLTPSDRCAAELYALDLEGATQLEGIGRTHAERLDQLRSEWDARQQAADPYTPELPAWRDPRWGQLDGDHDAERAELLAEKDDRRAWTVDRQRLRREAAEAREATREAAADPFTLTGEKNQKKSHNDAGVQGPEGLPEHAELLAEAAEGVRARTMEEVELTAAIFRERGEPERAEQVERCAAGLLGLVRRCECGDQTTTTVGTCRSTYCPICRDARFAAMRADILDEMGMQPWTGELVATLPDAPWIWCPTHRLDTRPECRDECPGARERSRADYHLVHYPTWRRRLREALETAWYHVGLVPYARIFPHTRGKESRVLHPHFNILWAGLAYDPQADELRELPNQFCPEDCESCSVLGPGHLHPSELERIKRIVCEALELPDAWRGAGPYYQHAPWAGKAAPPRPGQEPRPDPEPGSQQAHRVRYIFRNPAEGDPGRAFPRDVIEDVPERMHLNAPLGAANGRGHGAWIKARYLELRPELPMPTGELLGASCVTCGDALTGPAALIGPEGLRAIVQRRNVLVLDADGVLSNHLGHTGPPPELAPELEEARHEEDARTLDALNLHQRRRELARRTDELDTHRAREARLRYRAARRAAWNIDDHREELTG